MIPEIVQDILNEKSMGRGEEEIRVRTLRWPEMTAGHVGGWLHTCGERIGFGEESQHEPHGRYQVTVLGPLTCLPSMGR